MKSLAQAKALALGDDQRGPRQPQNNANDVKKLQLLAWKKCGKHDEKKRPQIGDEAHFHRRGILDRRKIYEMIPEEAGDAQNPHAPVLLPQARKYPWAEWPGQGSHCAAYQETHGRKLEGWNTNGQCGKERQKTPHDNRRESDKCCSAARHGPNLPRRAI